MRGLRAEVSELIAVSACVQLADIAADEIRAHPDGRLAQAMRAASRELNDDAEETIASLTPIVAEARSFVDRMLAAAGLQVPI